MMTFEDLSKELKLTPQQIEGIKFYINSLLIELLESIKQDHIKNFDETITNLKSETKE